MVESEIIEAEKPTGLPLHPPLTVGIAIDGKRNSKYLVYWALDKFAPEANVAFKLLHIRPVVTYVPTPMGNSIPIAQVREDVAAAYRKEIEWQTSQLLLPFNNICIRRKVKVDVTMIESNDVVNAIKEEVAKSNIKKLVIGVTPRGLFTRKMRGNSLSSRISASVPEFCTIFAVSKGKLLSIRPSDEETNGSSRDDSSSSSISNSSTADSSSPNFSSQSDFASVDSFSKFGSSSLPQRFQALSTENKGLLHTRTNSVDTNDRIQSNHSRCQSLDIDDRNYAESCCSSTWKIQHTSSQSSSSKSSQSDQASSSDMVSEYFNQVNSKFELEKLRIELRHIQGMYDVAQSEAVDASRKLTDLNNRRLEEVTKRKEIEQREDLVSKLALEEKERREAAINEAEYTRECAEREVSQREKAELTAKRDAKEKEKIESALEGTAELYQHYTWEEIVSATSSFSEKFKIGMGAYGTVYKCDLHHTTAAVKVLHSKENSSSKQFRKEIEILSKVRHPHLLILLGVCLDKGGLIYEYMQNGSLEDRLLRLNDTPPIPWFERFRIAWEVATALVFLHNAKPKPIVHRDLKPANILLDHNLVSKIGDVGLSTMVQSDVSYATTNTGPVGTLCYMDPEYQRTGLISPKSDVYAFGMVILQLLTAKPAIALAHIVETAIEEGGLLEILDPAAGDWPRAETKELALLGLSCAEMRQRDRPDLKDKVVPVLERLKEAADKARDAKEVSVAADEKEAIEKSLIANLPLRSKIRVPNHMLLPPIMEWKSNSQ